MNWGFTDVMLVVFGVLALLALGVAIRRCFFSKEARARKIKKRELKDRFHRLADEIHTEEQQYHRVKDSLPKAMPVWAIREIADADPYIVQQFSGVRRSLDCADGYIKCSNLVLADEYLTSVRRRLIPLRSFIARLEALPERIGDMRDEAGWKTIEALSLADQVRELGKAMSDQGVMLKIDAFDALDERVRKLEETATVLLAAVYDRSDEVIVIADEIIIRAGQLKQSLEYVAALRVYVPKRIAEHQHRCGDLLGLSDGAIRTLDRIKSFSADHVWRDLDQQVKEVPSMLTRAGRSFKLASEMHAAQSWFAAKQEVEKAVAIVDEVKSILDEISDLDAGIAKAKEGIGKALRDASIAIVSAKAVAGRENASVATKQLVLSASAALERASWLVPGSTGCDYIGAMEALGHAERLADEAIDRAKLDATPVIDIGPDIDLIVTELHGQGDAEAEKPEPVPPVDCAGEYVAVSRGGAGGGTSN